MGIFDALFGAPQPGGLLSDNNAVMALASGLLAGKKGQGLEPLSQGLMGAMQMHNQSQLNERANRQSDLAQLQGLYNTLHAQDMMQWGMDQAAGRPHVRNPALDQIAAKMTQAANLSPMSQGMAGAPMPPPMNMPAQAPSDPQSAPQMPSGPQMSTPQNPQFNVPPPPGASPSPAPGAPAGGMQGPPGNPFDAARQEAMNWAIMSGDFKSISADAFKRSMPQISRGVAFDQYGRPIGGMVDNLPIERAPDGSYRTIPNDITENLASRAGQVAAAKTGQQYTNVPMGNGQTQYMTNAQYESLRGLGLQPPQPGSQPSQPQPAIQANVPPQVQASRDQGRAAILQDELQRVLANPDKNLTVQAQNIAALRKEIAALPQAGAPASGALGVSPNPVAQAGLMKGSEGIGSVYGDAYKEIRTKGAEAPYQAAMLKEMLALTQGALSGQTGALAPMRQKWTEYLLSSGVPQNVVDALPQTLRNVPEAQEFVKLAMQRAMSQTRTMGAREAASVFNQVQQANPSMGLLSQSMGKIIQPLLGEQDWNAAKFKAADQWLANNNNNLAGFESDWNAKHPFTEFWKGSEQAKPQQSPGGWSIRKVN